MAKQPAIVTKQSLAAMLHAAPTVERQAQIIGRALVALFDRQTASEQSANTTDQNNNIGFAGCDALSGSLTAKSFIKRGTLESWQVQKWMQVSRGYPRICKYARQLNEIALEKAARKALATGQQSLLV